jgi:hypothetical protein
MQLILSIRRRYITDAHVASVLYEQLAAEREKLVVPRRMKVKLLPGDRFEIFYFHLCYSSPNGLIAYSEARLAICTFPNINFHATVLLLS